MLPDFGYLMWRHECHAHQEPEEPALSYRLPQGPLNHLQLIKLALKLVLTLGASFIVPVGIFGVVVGPFGHHLLAIFTACS